MTYRAFRYTWMGWAILLALLAVVLWGICKLAGKIPL